MKGVIKKIINWIKAKQYIIYFALGLFILEFYVRYINRTMKSFSCLDIIPNVFTVIWILIFSLLIYIITNKKIKKIISIIIYVLFIILFFTQIIFSRIFSVFFTFKDILYSGEGSKYFNTIINYVKISDFVVFIIMIVLMILSIFTYKYIKNETKKTRFITSLIVFVVIIILSVFVQIKIGKSESTTSWDSFSNKRNIYNQFNDTKRSLMLCGMYEYTFRDFYFSFIKRESIKNKEEKLKQINKYFESSKKDISEYNGIFKNKNLILVMLENIDTWMLNERSMPTLYKIKKDSIDFIEHYSATYASGKTFNTEFIANTGLIPNVTTLKTSYSYNQNNYDYALPSLFKKENYIVNSIHKNKGSFYNRDNMHLAWGYEKHFDYTTLEVNNNNIDMDTTVVSNNLDKFIYSDKFMTFFITYSAHMPYEYKKPECDKNIKYVKENFDNDNEEYLCAMSQAKETDDSIKLLIDELEKQDKLDDTVLIFFTDHYAYSMNNELVSNEKNEDDYNLKTKTPFFIYDNGKHKEKIDKVNSTLDILPTIADLFGLNYNPKIYFGNSIFNEDYKGIVIFNDKSWYDGDIYFKGELEDNIKYINKVNKEVNNILTLGGKVIETDYFRTYNINNKKK